jgi:hypothetical protein
MSICISCLSNIKTYKQTQITCLSSVGSRARGSRSHLEISASLPHPGDVRFALCRCGSVSRSFRPHKIGPSSLTALDVCNDEARGISARHRHHLHRTRGRLDGGWVPLWKARPFRPTLGQPASPCLASWPRLIEPRIPRRLPRAPSGYPVALVKPARRSWTLEGDVFSRGWVQHSASRGFVEHKAAVAPRRLLDRQIDR